MVVASSQLAVGRGQRFCGQLLSASRLLLFAVCCLLSAVSQAQTVRLSGFLSGAGVYATGPKTWLEGGFGRLDQSRNGAFAQAQLGLDWTPSNWFDVHVHGIARHDRDLDHAGVAEAYAEVRKTYTHDQFQLKAGEFFLPTSRENRGNLWTSNYAITFSALNSWIAEEVRPIGAEAEWRHELPNLSAITVAGTAFRGNDTMGTLLGWRGWAVSSRVATYREALPLPPLFSFSNPKMFLDQRDGTVPLDRDLDGRTGFAGRIRYSVPERGMIQFVRLDNRGERELYRDQYSWQTRFNLVSAELGSQDSTVLAAEYMNGDTGMGFRGKGRGWVQADFYATYVLLSHKYGRSRFTARIEQFATFERDHSISENNTEHGRAWALAWLYELDKHWRLGAEFTSVTGDRPAAAQSGADPNMDGHAVTVEARYGF
jgi:hypothetical protein